MRILHINCNYVGTALHRIMVNHLQDERHEITVFTPLWNSVEKKQFDAQTNEVISVCFKKIDKLFYYLKQRKIFSALIREIPSIQKYDIIHAFTLLTDGNVAYKCKKKYGIPYCVAIRDTDINDFFRLKPYLIHRGIRIMINAEAVFFLSDTYKENVFRNYIPKKKILEIEKKTFIIPNGIDDFWLNNLYSDKDFYETNKEILKHCITIICVGKINKRKNIPMLQKAINILREKNWKIEFCLIGRVEDKSEMEIITKDKETHYYPPVNKEELIKYYRQADVFCLASHTETFGLVYAEAMSQGLPVIYTRGQGFDGQFPDGFIGLPVDDKNPEDIASGIEKICLSYLEIAPNTINSIYKFDWNRICDKYREVYSEILLKLKKRKREDDYESR